MGDGRAIAGWFGFGAAAGVALGLLTYLLAEQGPEGSGWSLRGNGALIVPFGFGPAVFAAGWTAVAAHFGGRRRWRELGAGAGAIGAALVVLGLLALVFDSSAGALSAVAATLLGPVWMFAAPALAAMWHGKGRPKRQAGAAHLLAAACFALAVIGAFAVTSRLLPSGN
jgi:hypothetical protein